MILISFFLLCPKSNVAFFLKLVSVTRQCGSQSLGTVESVRRMPPPAKLPSLKDDGSSNESNIAQVLGGRSGNQIFIFLRMILCNYLFKIFQHIQNYYKNNRKVKS